MSGTLLPCEEEVSEKSLELSGLIAQFDDLFDICMSRPLTLEEQSELDDLFAYLQKEEDAHWKDVDPNIVEMIAEPFGVHFPTIRYQLHVLPDNYSE